MRLLLTLLYLKKIKKLLQKIKLPTDTNKTAGKSTSVPESAGVLGFNTLVKSISAKEFKSCRIFMESPAICFWVATNSAGSHKSQNKSKYFFVMMKKSWSQSWSLLMPRIILVNWWMGEETWKVSLSFLWNKFCALKANTIVKLQFWEDKNCSKKVFD